MLLLLGTEEDIALLRRAYAAWNRGDVADVLEAMSPDIEIHPVLGDVVAADSFYGHQGVRRWYATIYSSLDDFRADVEDVLEAGTNRYLVRLRFSGRGKTSGAVVSLEAAHLLVVQDGLATKLTGYSSWEEGLQAAHRAESEP